MNGWEMACVTLGYVTVVCATEWYETLAGAVLILAPLYYCVWR